MQRFDGYDTGAMMATRDMREQQWAREDAARETVSEIPTRFRWAKFGNDALLAERVVPADCVQTARDLFASAVPLSVVLTGPAGSGKTALGCALLREASAKLVRRGRFTDTFALALAAKRHKLGEGAAPELEDAIGAAVLLLDELGCERSSDQSVEEVIRRRHNEGRPTIFTTPHADAVIAEKYGDGIARRVFENAPVIRLGGKQ